MKQLTVSAHTEYLGQIHALLRETLKHFCWKEREIEPLELAVEEIFVNICHYAYSEEGGNVWICVEYLEELAAVKISLMDWGISYNPLDEKEPDLELDALQRPIGGLGIFLMRNIVDQVTYVRNGNANCLTLVKYQEKG